MSCPICDNKSANCDCPPEAIRLHEENEKLRTEVFELRTKETQAANRAHVAELQKRELYDALFEIVGIMQGSQLDKDVIQQVYGVAVDAIALKRNHVPACANGSSCSQPGGCGNTDGNDWCSNCGAVLATKEGRSFPSCDSCS